MEATNSIGHVMPACVVERELPLAPHGWFKRFVGFDLFVMMDGQGIETPICYIDRSFSRGKSGYSLPFSILDPMQWSELRKIWPAWLDEHYPQPAEDAA